MEIKLRKTMKSPKILLQNIGIDMAKNTFVACIGFLLSDLNKQYHRAKEFSNDLTGFEAFLKWVLPLVDPKVTLQFTMEATGVYHQRLAYYLHQGAYQVSVVLATHAKHFKESQPQNSKNDILDAQSLATMGLERRLPPWQPLSPFYQELKDLTRERSTLCELKTRIINQLKALENAASCSAQRRKMVEDRLGFIKRQIKEVEKAIKKHLHSKADVKQKVEHLLSIPGVGITVVATVLAETNGFGNVKNKRQLIAYAGFALKENSSGDFKGKNHIIRKGNKHIKRVFFFPPFVAKGKDEHMGNFYQRVIQKYPNGKAAGMALARKMLGTMYALWKNNTAYDAAFNYVGGSEAP